MRLTYVLTHSLYHSHYFVPILLFILIVSLSILVSSYISLLDVLFAKIPKLLMSHTDITVLIELSQGAGPSCSHTG